MQDSYVVFSENELPVVVHDGPKIEATTTTKKTTVINGRFVYCEHEFHPFSDSPGSPGKKGKDFFHKSGTWGRTRSRIEKLLHNLVRNYLIGILFCPICYDRFWCYNFSVSHVFVLYLMDEIST